MRGFLPLLFYARRHRALSSFLSCQPLPCPYKLQAVPPLPILCHLTAPLRRGCNEGEVHMAGNTFGQALRLTTFGESHGVGLGGVIDGCPAGMHLTEADIQAELDRRKPGQGPTATKRKESDTVRLLSGVYEGVTTVHPSLFTLPTKTSARTTTATWPKCFAPGTQTGDIFRSTTAYATTVAAAAHLDEKPQPAWLAALLPARYSNAVA